MALRSLGKNSAEIHQNLCFYNDPLHWFCESAEKMIQSGSSLGILVENSPNPPVEYRYFSVRFINLNWCNLNWCRILSMNRITNESCEAGLQSTNRQTNKKTKQMNKHTNKQTKKQQVNSVKQCSSVNSVKLLI